MSNIKELSNILDDTARLIQKAQVNFKKCPKDRLTLGYLEARKKTLEDYWVTFMQAHNELVSKASTEQKRSLLYFTNDEFFTSEDLYLSLGADLRDMIISVNSRQQLEKETSRASPNASFDGQNNVLKLPRIQLPTFSGNYDDWPTFKDLFTSLVHDNTSISDVQKLHYLKSTITGEAELLLKHIQVTHSNYAKAWETLKDRYGNKRLIVNSVLKRLFNQKKIGTQSATQLKHLLDTTSECLNNLQSLNIPTDSWDPLMIFLTVQKLDPESHKEWEEYAYKENSDELPMWNDFKMFLQSKFRTLELVSSSSRDRAVRERSYHVTTPLSQPSSPRTCVMCKDSHTLCHCKDFTKMEPTERNEYVRKNNLCYNCLVPGHSAKRCRLQMSCRLCHRRHHTLLHQNKQVNVNQSDNLQSHYSNLEGTQDDTIEKEEDVAFSSHFTANQSTALLATALVPVKDESGNTTVLRALIDQGSQATFITERAAQLLQLKRIPVAGTITGVGSASTNINHVVHLEVLSRCDRDFNLQVKAYIMATRLTTQLPSKSLSCTTWPHLEGLFLADPSFNQPGRIDMLLGVEVCAQIMKSEIVKGPPGTPCAQNTSLGWILFGNINERHNIPSNIVVMHHHIDINNMLKGMWELEQTDKYKQTAEERQCEEIYEATTTRGGDGRYIVKLPMKTDTPTASKGETRDIAMKRLEYLERRFEKNAKLKAEYKRVLEEYIDMNHMEEVPEKELINRAVYLPHHAVIKEDKETSKVRVVFDASAKASNNVSLNDELLVGPPLQEDMRSLIMRWRMKPVCFVADIQCMYREILVTPEDTDFQRILWRRDKSEPVKDYRLLRVTFGTASAPYLAVKTLQKLAEDEGTDQNSNVTQIIKEDFYMDDLMSGKDTVPEAIRTAKEVRDILQKGGFSLRKWCSNSKEFLQHFDPKERSTHVTLNMKVDGTIRALGVSWNMGQDVFQYDFRLPPALDHTTKRSILSEMQRFYDPLGWITPATLLAKLLIQALWLQGVGWDQEVDPTIKIQWLELRHEFQSHNKIEIQRWLHTTQDNLEKITLHGFCDASTKAYGAVVYLRVQTKSGEIKVSVIAAKGRVAPVKSVTLPRLELCGAVLLSRLLKQVKEAMRIPSEQVVCWTDSSVVLAWLFGDPARWQTFVRNRVVEILDNVGNQWYHVHTQENPADLASRGLHLSKLKECKIWWRGPEWLYERDIKLRRPDNIQTNQERKETIQTSIAVVENENGGFVKQFEECETLKELLKAITYCRRFLNYKTLKDIEANFTTDELEESLKKCVRIEQREKFGDEIDTLKQSKSIRRTSRLKSLNPFLDGDNVLRVGGRLQHATDIEDDGKHPIILDSKGHFANLIVADAHKKTLHGGIQLMMGYLRSRYWMLQSKGLVKKIIHKCLICAKQNARTRTQIMGDLPKVRVTPSRAFLYSGVDFAGPFHVLMSKGRGSKTYKAYVAIFVCMVTKSIHLELVGDLTSEAFIGAFKRFVARRGKCSHIWSDQGRTFVGANKELAAAWSDAKLEFEGEIANSLASDGTQWHFIPAYSPNFGGLWEAGVKSMKYHLKRIMNNNLTFEEMSTLLCEIEACLNSRPLSPIDESDTQNVVPLTSGHFLIGEAPVTVPMPDLRVVKMSHLSRWQFLQRLLRDFWHKWQQEYMSRLQQRPKWVKRQMEFEIGDIVLIKADNLPPGKWSLGRILDKHPGLDGHTRVYSVKSGDSITKRTVSKLCPMPIEVE